jgi:hypothetical protein
LIVLFPALNFHTSFLLLASSQNNGENSNNTSDNTNSENNENSNSDSISDSNSDSNSDDPEDVDAEEIRDPEHNAPERIMDDLDIIDKARNNDPDALEYLRREYGEFFNDTSDDQALNDIEEYLEEEFPKEHERSENEADALKAKENAEDIEKEIKELEKEAQETTDPQRKENLSLSIKVLTDRAQEERAKAEKS